MKKKYFINQYLQGEYFHGGIGCVDAEKIFQLKGFRPLTFPYHHNFSLRAKMSRLFFLISTFFAIKKNSVVIFVFPLYAVLDKLLVRLMLIKAKVKVICFIVDIDGIKDGDKKKLRQEVSFFEKIKYFIVLNEKMKQWLDTKVPDNHSSKIDFHSFLTEPVSLIREKSFEVIFAGNLGKSHFLEKLYLLYTESSSLHFNLYGPHKTSAMINQSNVTWHGFEKPYELPAKLKGSFGLVWDGDSIEEPVGSLGHYMQYISHHKLSLYILSKLPVIVAATAASAPLIEKYKIGFAVNSLFEIEGKIKNISATDYRQMQLNMQPLAEKISKGESLSNAIDEVMKLV